MTEWQSGDVDAGGIRIHYWRTGGNKPPLVLAHGATDNGLCWTPVARVLEREYDIVMPDARGHGFSDAPEEGYDPADHAADLAGLIRALDLRQPAVIGHSMGALTTLYLAAGYPELLRCAVLEDSPFRETRGPLTEEERAARDAWLAERRREVVASRELSREGLVARIRAEQPAWSEEELGPWADAKLQVSVNYLSRARPLPDWRGALRRVTCPLLLITADTKRGGMVTPEVAEEARRLQPRLQIVRLQGAGHNIRRERFEEYMEAVVGFLTSTSQELHSAECPPFQLRAGHDAHTRMRL